MQTKISARTTTTALRKHVFPILKAAGFDDWTSRRAWRHLDSSIDCVEFRSFNAYYADVLCCTTASISVWMGSWPSFFPPSEYPPKEGPKGPRPDESEMPIRGQLAPSVRNSLLRTDDLIWLVKDKDGAEAAALEIAEQFRSYGLSWFNKNWQASVLLKRLVQDTEGYAELEKGLHGAHQYLDAGNPDSPVRNRMIAELAVAVEDYEIAAEKYERARWARNMKTGERYLYLSEVDNQKLLDLVAKCKQLASNVPTMNRVKPNR